MARATARARARVSPNPNPILTPTPNPNPNPNPTLTLTSYPASLPEALRPKPGGLQPAQRRVYEDFGRIPRTAAMVQQQQAQQA